MALQLGRGPRCACGSGRQWARLETEGSCDPFPWTCVTPHRETRSLVRLGGVCTRVSRVFLHNSVSQFSGTHVSQGWNHTRANRIHLLLQLLPDVVSTGLEQICVFNTDLIFNSCTALYIQRLFPAALCLM